MHDWVTAKGIVLSRKILEGAHEISRTHDAVVRPWPAHHPAKRPLHLDPDACHLKLDPLVVGDEDALFPRRSFEMSRVVGPFGKRIDGAKNVPAHVPKRVYHGTVDVRVGIQWEPPCHLSKAVLGEISGLRPRVVLVPAFILGQLRLDFGRVFVEVQERGMNL